MGRDAGARRPTYGQVLRLRHLYARSRSTPLKAGPSGKLASARSATGDPACSVAASNWRRKKASPADFKQLAQCRAHAATLKAAHLHRVAGNEAHAQHIEKIASGEFLTKKARREQAGKIKATRTEARAGRGKREAAEAVPAESAVARSAPNSPAQSAADPPARRRVAPGRNTPERAILAEAARRNYRSGIEIGSQKDPRNNKGVNRDAIPMAKSAAKEAATGDKTIDHRRVTVGDAASRRGRMHGEKIAEAAAKIGFYPSQFGPGFYNRTTKEKASLADIVKRLGDRKGAAAAAQSTPNAPATPSSRPLPKLKGSEKQVAWAERIRDDHLDQIDRTIAAIEREFAEDGDPLSDHALRKIRRLKVAAHMIRTIPDAGFLIDHRNHPESVLPVQSPATFERWAKAAGV